MREMTLQEIQSVSLEMMKDVHRFCVNNGIHYSLAYGSLLGAVRHKGFIPWDDDIDIWMPRPDYDRFSKEYKSGNGYLLSPVYDKDSYLYYTRVYDNNTLVDCLRLVGTCPRGIWIDVFPIDAISDEDAVSNNQFQRIRHLTNLVGIYRHSIGRLKHKTRLFDRIKAIVRLIQLKIFVKGDVNHWRKSINEICCEYIYGMTERCSSLLCLEANIKNRQEIFATDDFSLVILSPFEDAQFYISANYDHILRTIFGEYMVLPPKEKRVSHFLHNWKFYWK